MAKTVQKSSAKTPAKTAKKKSTWNFPLIKQNFIYLGIGVASILIGYGMMATAIGDGPALASGASWNNVFAVYIAPFFLVFGYCVCIPYSILKLFKSKEETAEVTH